ncbi:MAG: flagellar basal body rod protein FlgC [Candidatus Cloacimonetes bacterium]|nr:flagellar basal body rod protein FlgC [Candidatus Cloacimonadota bacterium]
MLNSLFGTIDIGASGLNVQRTRLNIVAQNIANAETTRTEDGEAYRRQIAVVEAGTCDGRFRETLRESQLQLDRTSANHMPAGRSRAIERCGSAGVHVAGVIDDPAPFKMIYDPHHPDADENGYVAMPNVNIVQEMTELINTTRSFEANVTVITSAKEMIRKAIKL